MISFLQKFRSNRATHDGWAVFIPGSTMPLVWTTSTTRQEVRDLLRSRPDLYDYFRAKPEVVKVKITVEVVR